MTQDAKRDRIKAEDVEALRRIDAPADWYWDRGFDAALAIHAVRHGYWESVYVRGNAYNKCSSCLHLMKNRSPFCPHCGAKMDEVEW